MKLSIETRRNLYDVRPPKNNGPETKIHVPPYKLSAKAERVDTFREKSRPGLRVLYIYTYGLLVHPFFTHTDIGTRGNSTVCYLT